MTDTMQSQDAHDALRVLTTINATPAIRQGAFAQVDDALALLVWIERYYPQVVEDARDAITEGWTLR